MQQTDKVGQVWHVSSSFPHSVIPLANWVLALSLNLSPLHRNAPYSLPTPSSELGSGILKGDGTVGGLFHQWHCLEFLGNGDSKHRPAIHLFYYCFYYLYWKFIPLLSAPRTDHSRHPQTLAHPCRYKESTRKNSIQWKAQNTNCRNWALPLL